MISIKKNSCVKACLKNMYILVFLMAAMVTMGHIIKDKNESFSCLLNFLFQVINYLYVTGIMYSFGFNFSMYKKWVG